MGNQQDYIENGGFKRYLYETVGEVENIGGFRCEIIRMPTDTDIYHAGLPSYSNTADIYVCFGPGNIPKQMRVYKGRSSYKDFDWGHEHKNSDGTKFPKGTVHVQRYPGANGGDARYMTAGEHKLYDIVIQHYAPHAVLTPSN